MSAVLPIPQGDDFLRIPAGDRVLVGPTKMKFSWTRDERPYRSLILRDLGDGTGEVLSACWPKFLNAGEPDAAEDAAALDAALRDGDDVWITRKEDGSACIRSVIDGQVIFRTRGTHDGGPFGPVMRAVAEQRYPVLLDPAFCPDVSLLFEFVSHRPEFRIVLSYAEDDLIFLGGIDHADLRLLTPQQTAALAAEHDLRLVDTIPVATSLDLLAEQIREWKNEEGVVARVQDGQILVKIKAAAYLLLHRLRTQLSAKGVRQLIDAEDIRSEDDYRRVLVDEQGADWEMLSDTLPLLRAYLTAIDEAEVAADTLAAEVAAASARLPERGDFARQYASQLDRSLRAAAFMLLDGRVDAARAAIREAHLDRTQERLRAAEQDVVHA